MADDFGAVGSMLKETEQGKKAKDTEQGKKHLGVYETLPPQMPDDFGALGSMLKETEQGKKATDTEQGKKHLRVYETLPPQMLNAAGPAQYAKMTDEAVWTNMSEQLKSGAKYMTELCGNSTERRGVGMNRALHALSSIAHPRHHQR